MKYIYRIVGNFTQDNFSKILSKISPKFNYVYVDKTLYIALKKWTEYESSINIVQKSFKPVRDFYIEAIDENNIMHMSSVVKEWCLNNLVRLDTERYESENQEKLKQVWESMNKMEDQLKAKLQEKYQVNG